MENNATSRIVRFIISIGITAAIAFAAYHFFAESKEVKALCEDIDGTVITEEVSGFLFDSPKDTCTAISCGSVTEEQCWVMQKKFRGTDTPNEHFIYDEESGICMMGGDC